MKESGRHSPWTGQSRDRLTDAAYLEAPAFLQYSQSRWGPPIFADGSATQPQAHTLAPSAWVWTPYRWDPDELRVTLHRPDRRRVSQTPTDRSPGVVAGPVHVARPVLLGRGRRQILAATLLAILIVLGLHLFVFGAELAPVSASTPSNEEASQSAPSVKCDASTDRMLYVATLDQCFPAEW